MALTFDTYMQKILAEKRDENIKAVMAEVKSKKISSATRKKIATQAFKAGQNVERFMSEIWDSENRYAAAMVASDPKKQIKNEDIIKGYLKLHGLTAPTNLLTLIQEDDGGDQRKNRKAFIEKIRKAPFRTTVLVSLAKELDIDAELQMQMAINDIQIQTPDEYVNNK